MASKFKREFKNVVYNYSDAEAKVREATSNDPWGPSSAVMSELADYTYHVQAYSLVMGMLWKRLNDHGKNWRHVYKSLTVLEYLIKGGSERVSQQCKDNMFSIQTLKDFQYVDKDGKDQGANVRDKAKQLVTLLKDDRKLKEERAKAHTARERQQALGSDSPGVVRSSPNPNKKVTFSPDSATSPSSNENGRRVQPVEQARPSNESEEELQLKLALQLSKQQADEEDKLRRQEEDSLSAALAMSTAELTNKDGDGEEENGENEESTAPPPSDLLLDLDASLKDPWGGGASGGGGPTSSEPLPSYDSIIMPTPGGAVATVDPWSMGGAPVKQPSSNLDPWSSGGGTGVSSADPWNPSSTSTAPNPLLPAPAAQNNPFDLSDLGLGLPPLSSGSNQPLPKIEAQFLGTNANLVDLDLLAAPAPKPQLTATGPSPSNPFGLSPSSTINTSPSSSLAGPKSANPFDSKAQSPSLNQLATTTTGFAGLDPLQPPLVPVGTATTVGGAQTSGGGGGGGSQTFNPFS